MKTFVVYLNIKRDKNSWSSKDIHMCLYFKNEYEYSNFILNSYENTTSTNKFLYYIICQNEEDDYICFSWYEITCSDKRLFEQDSTRIIDFYTQVGFKIGRSTEISEYYKRMELIRLECREKEGYILSFPREQYSVDRIQGGFSDKLWKHFKEKPYLSSYPGGYFGYSNRKVELDEYVEAMFFFFTTNSKLKDKLNDIFYSWLSSSDARHFCDELNYEGELTESVKKKIAHYAKTMHNTGYIYTLEEHEGNYGSTIELSDKNKEFFL